MKRHLRQYGCMGMLIGVMSLFSFVSLSGLIGGTLDRYRFDPWMVMAFIPLLILAFLIWMVRRQVEVGKKEWEGGRSWLYLISFALSGIGIYYGANVGCFVATGSLYSGHQMQAGILTMLAFFVPVPFLLWFANRR